MFEDVRDLYNAIILERGRRPLHMRRLECFDATARGDNPMCGDQVEVWVQHGPDGRVAELGFIARGCEISKASADLMAEAVQGQDDAELRRLAEGVRAMAQTGDLAATGAAQDMLRPLAAVHEYPSRVKCVTLPWQALVTALDAKGQAGNE